VLFTGKKQFHCRILPAFDLNMSPEDSAFATSVVPYRDIYSGRLNEKSGTPEFTSWFAVAKGYKFFGRIQTNFLSPLTLKALGSVSVAETADPVQDCRQYCRNSGDPALKALAEKPADQGKVAKAVVPRESDLALYNIYYPEQNEWKSAIGVTSLTAHEDLEDKLSWQTPRTQAEVIDANFPDYLFGDITNPQTGLLASVSQFKVGQMGVIGFNFSTKAYTTEGSRLMPVTEKELAARRMLMSDQTLKILGYQDIVDLIVDDGTIPYEIIQHACSHMANIPAAGPRNATYSHANANADGSPLPTSRPPVTGAPGMPVGGGMRQPPTPPAGASRPTPPAAPQKPTPPAPPQKPAPPAQKPAPPVKEEPKFWVNGPTGVNDDPSAASAIQTMVDLGGDPQIQPVAGGDWKLASEYGFVKKPAPTTVAAGAKPTPPAAPSKPAPPAAPAKPTPPPAPAKETPPPAPKTEYWVISQEGQEAQEMTKAQLQALVDAGGIGADVALIEDTENRGWGKPADFGFGPDAIPGLPVENGGDGAAGGTIPGLTEEESAEFNELNERMTNTAHPKGALSTEDMQRIVELTQKQHQG